MSQFKISPTKATLNKLRWPLRLTRLGMVAERVTRAFWPVWTVCLAVLAALMLGLHDRLSSEVFWGIAVVSGLAMIWFVWSGIRQFYWPSAIEASARLDATLPGQPLAALADHQAIGANDEASRAVWKAHLSRMREATRAAHAVQPDLRVSRNDPFGLRYMAVLAFIVAVSFGSIWRIASVTELAVGGQALATGPSWEGWVEPPTYTGKPSLYLNDIAEGPLLLPKGSLITVHLYGEVGSLAVSETVSGRNEVQSDNTELAEVFTVETGGTLSVEGSGGRSWQVSVIADKPPSIEFDGDMDVAASGEMRQPFAVTDDYGVVGGQAEITLDLGAVDRRYGLAIDPDPREAIVLDLPMTISGDRGEFSETLVENLSLHPWSGLPVRIVLRAEDALGQNGKSEPLEIALPGRRFFDPLARSVIEGRRDLLWATENAPRVAQVLRAVTHRPEDFVRSTSAYLMLRVAIRRLEAGVDAGLSDESKEEIATALWDIAVLLEDGNLSDALERMHRAQDRLSQAMREGASDAEIAGLMQELREATQDYLRQLAQNPREGGDQQQADSRNMQQLTEQDLQDMMDRIQELMEQGRMEEAQELLDQLAEMMENMQVTEGAPNGEPGGEGEQAMQGLEETLRGQQGLSDDAFRDLQEQFNPGAQAGQSDENEGRNGGEGRGQSHEGQGGQGSGDGELQGDGQSGGQERSLAERQRELRESLRQQQNGLPGAGTPEGDAARGALDQAGRAMDGAEEALRNNDLAEALDNQAEAMEALREGMRQLGEALAQQNSENQGQQGQVSGEGQARDPLGRNAGARGNPGTNEGMLQGADVYRRARELLNELRDRAADQTRPKPEIEYLKRLLDRF
ncbi:TIGR02302 family protein [Pseudohalocynthiibacter aestuariivivens]|uniref:TIGR02302 family protein n=1 Tax=Pseudohalocynthiibacter aestuariivivens TaxID=1591409 RepID=A0ABV5JI82_9RHOB|nr:MULTISPECIES: TIGR02302 family protein [Pseudohalocynthiibacter]MBS9717472.1 TIGR02302 family protein [Pseudohalocynthiibacter aestuariivivens]MCK0102193.1 TIGR02302 family protein [Pseudohalocynthiibacter sp. F2068]